MDDDLIFKSALDDDDDDKDFEQLLGSFVSSTTEDIEDKLNKGMNEEQIQAFKETAQYKELSVEKGGKRDLFGNIITSDGTVSSMFGLTSNRFNAIDLFAHNCIEADPVEQELYEETMAKSPGLQRTFDSGCRLLPTFPALQQDLFMALYKYKPVMFPTNKVHYSAQMNRQIVELIVESPEFITIRANCRVDLFNSAIGCEILADYACGILENYLNKVKELEKNLQAADDLLKKEQAVDDIQQKMMDIDDLIDQSLRKGDGAGAQKLQEQFDDLQTSLEQAKELARMQSLLCDDIVSPSDDIEKDIEKRIGEMVDKATMQTNEMSQYIEAWGMGGSNAGRISYENKLQVMQRMMISPKLKKFTTNLGRFKDTAREVQKKKSKNGSAEISTIKTGDNLELILPSEKANLCNKTTRKDFMLKYTSKGLMEYEKVSSNEKNKGPIIICIDTSGSITSDQDVWEKSIAAGMLETAHLQKRDFACIIYSDKADEPITILKDEIAPDKVMDIVERYHNGGTNFEAPLTKALNMIKTSKWNKADIVFITDGQANVSDVFLKKFLKTKEEKQFKVQGIVLDAGRGRATKTSVSSFCDEVVKVSDLADLDDPNSDVVHDIFNYI